MTTGSDQVACVSCGRGDSEAALLTVRFRGFNRWICSQCFPMLIHNPRRLAGRLEGAESLQPAKHDED